MPRKRSSPAEDFIDIVALLPWWGGVLAAAVAYWLLHSLATPPVASAVQPGKTAAFVQSALVYGFANAGQIIVPILCLVAAAVSYFRRRHRRNLVLDVRQAAEPAALDGITWREFEMLVGEDFRTRGYSVLETGGGGADGGVDLVLRKEGATYLVQCKQWKAYSVGASTVRELFGLMSHHRAAGAFVVTSGHFTEEAQAFAQGKNIVLIDGRQLVARIKGAQVMGRARTNLDPPAPQEAKAPSCPVCSAPMVRRTAKKGTQAGNQFWGCSHFPACRGTR